MLKYFSSELVYTLLLTLIVIILLWYFKKAINKFSFLKSIELNRRKVVVKLFHLFIYILSAILLTLIWAVDFKQLSLFISSTLAVLGVGFFAQWSLLSNLTASIILFFSHPVRLGNRIRILDKDFDLTGRVVDISGFYMFLLTDDNREITIPNSIVVQKSIEILDTEKPPQILKETTPKV